MARLAVEKEQIVFLLKKQNGWELFNFDSSDNAHYIEVIANSSNFVAFKKGPTS